MTRGTRSFRYGARFALTAPLAGVFLVVAFEMILLASTSDTTWRIIFGAVGSVATLMALAMLREVVGRIRGKRRIVVAQRELEMPGEKAIAFRDIKKLELVGERSYKRSLKITHATGELEIAGVMLGSVGELDEIHGLIKAGRKTR